jgi:oligosaccharide repeat unit polymerase
LNEFSQFDWFVIVLDATPSVIPYQYGQTFVQLFAQFVPRMFWQDKPLPIEYVVTRLLTGVESGSPFTIIGELYLNFLWPGIIVGMIVFGILVRSVYGYLQSNPGNPGVVLIYGYIYASLFQLYTRSFAPMMFFLIIFLIPAGLALWFIRDRTAPEAALH